jgi:hypothetical protein
MKPKIVFLFSGQCRNSPFGLNHANRNLDILDSYNTFIFTPEFKQLYSYKIYISTDDIHLDDVISYFSEENIGNIHLLNTELNTEYYLKPKPPNTKIPNIEYYLDKYNNYNIDWSIYDKYENSIFQHYKILDCYNLFMNDADADADEYNYIIRLRMDTQFNSNITDYLALFDIYPESEIFMDYDLFAIGKPNIMNCFCNGLDNSYGNYNYQVDVPEDVPIMKEYHFLEKKRWTYAPERQLFEMLFEYCNSQNKDISQVIQSIHCCFINRFF